MGGVGISKVANLLKSLDSESILKQIQHRIQNDKIGISFIMIQPDCRSPARSGTGRERVGQVPFGTGRLTKMPLINEKALVRPFG